MARKKMLFGQTAGQVHPAAGAAIGVGLGTGTAIAVRTFTGHDKWAEAIGGGVGILSGAAMMMSKAWRPAGVAAIVGTLLNNGLRTAEALLSNKQKAKDLQGRMMSATANRAEAPISIGDQYKAMLDAAKAMGLNRGFGIVSAQQVPTLGAYTAQQVPTLGAYAAQRVQALGEVQAERRQLAGSPVTFQGGGSPVQLVGARGIGALYGATVGG